MHEDTEAEAEVEAVLGEGVGLIHIHGAVCGEKEGPDLESSKQGVVLRAVSSFIAPLAMEHKRQNSPWGRREMPRFCSVSMTCGCVPVTPALPGSDGTPSW